MRETGVVSWILGNDADTAIASKPYLGIARTQLGITKNLMKLGGLGQLTRRVVLADGAILVCQSVLGQDIISITPPVVLGKVASTQDQAERVEPVPTWYVAGYQTVGGFSKPTVWTNTGATLLPTDGYDEGEAVEFVTDTAGNVVAVIGWLHTTIDEVVWWERSGTSWALQYAGFAFNRSRFFFGSPLEAWDFTGGEAVSVAQPSVTPANAPPHQLRVAVQDRWLYYDPGFPTPPDPGAHTYTTPYLIAVEINDGIDVFTLGQSDVTGSVVEVENRSLDDWVSALEAGTSIPVGYDRFTSPDPDEPTSTLFATIFGPYDVEAAMTPDTIDLTAFGAHGAQVSRNDVVAGFWVAQQRHPVVSVAGPLVGQVLTWSKVSLDGEWAAALHTIGYANAGGSSLSFGGRSEAMRYSTGTGIQALSSDPARKPVYGLPRAAIGGIVAATESLSDPTASAIVRWSPTREVIVNEAGTVAGLSPRGSAACGFIFSDNFPYVWSATRGLERPGVAAGTTYGGARAVTDDARAAVGYLGNDAFEWAVLWVDGAIALQLDDSDLSFYDVAIDPQ